MISSLRTHPDDPTFLALSLYRMKAEIQAEVRTEVRTTEERTMENISNNRRRSIGILASSRLIGCILLLSLVSAAGAQQKTARPIHPRQHTVHKKAVVESEIDSLSKKLKLTDAQKPRVKAILEKKDEQIKRVMENPSLQARGQPVQEISQNRANSRQIPWQDSQTSH